MSLNGEGGEERGLERRVFQLEQHMNKLLITTAVTEAKVQGLVSTIESRFKAFDHGQELILERLKALDAHLTERIETQSSDLDARVKRLEEIRHQAAGVLLMIRVLGITGIIGGVIAIVKMIRGGE